jgi:hypothetical protein
VPSHCSALHRQRSRSAAVAVDMAAAVADFTAAEWVAVSAEAAVPDR